MSGGNECAEAAPSTNIVCAMARRERLIKKGKDPKEIEMPVKEDFSNLKLSHANKDGTQHIEDIHDIPPLIEPYTIFYHFWNIFEFIESVAGNYNCYNCYCISVIAYIITITNNTHNNNY